MQKKLLAVAVMFAMVGLAQSAFASSQVTPDVKKPATQTVLVLDQLGKTPATLLAKKIGNVHEKFAAMTEKAKGGKAIQTGKHEGMDRFDLAKIPPADTFVTTGAQGVPLYIVPGRTVELTIGGAKNDLRSKWTTKAKAAVSVATMA